MENILNTEILCNDYTIYRRDRGSNIKGGGVLIAVSNVLSSEAVITDFSVSIEFIVVKIKLKHKNILITCSYIPPNSSDIIYRKHSDAITTLIHNANQRDSIMVVGDFNMPLISWSYSFDDGHFIPLNSRDNLNYIEFLNILLDLSLYQLNGIYNKNQRLLDLVFVSECVDITLHRSHPITLPEDGHHPTIEINISIPTQSTTKPPSNVNRKVFCYKKTNYILLIELLNNTNWQNLLSYSNNNIGNPTNIDKVIENFYNVMYSYMDQCIPKQFDYKHTGPPWNSKNLTNLKNKKSKLYKKYKKTGSTVIYAQYSVARADYNKANQTCYSSYLDKIKNNFKSDPKSFYNFVNSKRRSTAFPSVMKFLDIESGDDLIISNMFADFFSTTYSDACYDESNSYPFSESLNQSISIPFLNVSTVLRSLKNLKFSYINGPDKIPSCLLISCSEALAVPLTLMFNMSIKYGYFPKIWKDSFIIPLFKSGNKSNISNYRGIAKLSTIPKLFEKLITDHLCHQVTSIMSPYQHGFRKGCSAVSNLLHLTTLVNRGFVQHKQTDAVYTDFSKAFDKVNHKLLLKKLDQMGFTNMCLKWINSYLINRKQTVCFKNVTSKSISVLSGVPQGSHLGPLLFSLFINDLPKSIKFSCVLMYADDVKIFLTYNQYADHIFLQRDLDAFQSWCDYNLMELNPKKCKYMCFFRKSFINVKYVLGGCELEKLDVFSDLGILLDSKLNFIKHISLTVNKARGVLGFIKRWAKEFTDPYVTKQLYISLVRPILEYGSIIWDPSYKVYIERIESVQKQFLLFCLRGLQWNPLNLPSYKSRLALIKLPTLKSRRTMLSVSFVLNIINGNVCSDFLLSNITFRMPFRPSRYYYPISIEVFSTNYANSDPFRRICGEFNKLYQHIDFSLNASVIKCKLILFLNS